MKGEGEKTNFETINKNNERTKEASTEEPPEGSTSVAACPQASSARIASLEAIALQVTGSKDVLPVEVLKVTLKRYRRMPRGGWQHLHRKFCWIFNAEISLREFIRQANFLLTDSEGKICNRRKFKEDDVKRIKMNEESFREVSIQENKTYLDVKDKYYGLMSKAANRSIEEWKGTKKFTRMNTDTQLLSVINLVADEYSRAHPPKNMAV